MKCRHGPALKMNFWHLSIPSIHSKRMSTSITVTVPPNATAPMLQRVKTPSILLIAGVHGIYIGSGLGRKGGNARTGAEKGGMQHR